jgi:anti-sigma factor RsiW
VTSKHLGDKIHDLLDGRLVGDKAYTAMAHLGECEDCAARFHELRAAREALNTAEAGIDIGFAQRLLDRERIAQIASQEPPHRARASAPRDHRPTFAVIGVAAAASFVVAVAWVMGAPTQVGLEFVTTASGNSAQPVAYMGAQGMRSGDQLRSWIHPDFSTSGLVPVEAKVLQRSNGSNVLVATLLRGMDVVVVTQEHARLASVVNDLPHADVEGIDVFVLSSAEPAQVVWQTGDVVVALGCECALSTLESVAAEFPTAEHPSFVDRVGEGFQELADLMP